MSDLPDLFPAQQRLPTDREAAIRSAVIAAVGETAASGPRLRWRWAAIPAFVVAAAALALLQPWATPAAWASVPQRLDASATADLGASCASRISGRHFPIALADATPVLAEARGTSTAVLLASSSQIQICVIGSVGEFFGVYEVSPLTPSSRGTVDGVPGSREGGEALRAVFGRLRSDEDAVTVTTADGLVVTASVGVSGGSAYFLAWWPSHADASTVAVRGPSGSTDFLAVPDQAAPSPASTAVGS